ncbi:MAG: branched-chain amino acid ABC transporter permease [Burkholderiales bacterium]|nr:branched-chain amino acid ABC transporter permease [Burkholderiales bacterium]
MDVLLQQLLNGLVVGSIYALIALGYTMVYGILQIINFAHGEIVMMGAMITISAINMLSGAGVNLPGPLMVLAGLLIAMPVTMLLGFTIERVAYRPLRKAPRLAPLITAIGISIVLQQVAVLIWKNNPRSFPSVLSQEPHNFFGASITELQVAIVVLALVIMIGLLIMVEKTKLGRAMRAVSMNQAVAGLMGVNINYVISMTFIIGSGLGAIAGVMVGANYGLAYPTMGFMIGLKAFTAAVLGGIGNLGGAVAGGILLGIIESVGAGYLGPLTGGILGSQYQDIFAFLVLIIVLVLRPSGLLGERVAERA